jgi:hypothetical protein
VFVFNGGDDLIGDFRNRELIEIDTELGIATYDALRAAATPVEGGDSVRFDFDGGHSLTVEDLRIGELRDGMFDFI